MPVKYVSPSSLALPAGTQSTLLPSPGECVISSTYDYTTQRLTAVRLGLTNTGLILIAMSYIMSDDDPTYRVLTGLDAAP